MWRAAATRLGEEVVGQDVQAELVSLFFAEVFVAHEAERVVDHESDDAVPETFVVLEPGFLAHPLDVFDGLHLVVWRAAEDSAVDLGVRLRQARLPARSSPR